MYCLIYVLNNIFCLITTILTILVISLDTGYYVRALVVVYFGRIFQRKYNIEETTTVYSICTTRDVDFSFTHMNSARYIRILDSCKMHFGDRIDLWNKILAQNGGILQGASTVCYRGPIGLFHLYKIETKILCWDDKSVYFEHKFITSKDNFVRAVVLSQTHVVGLDVSRLMADFPGSDSIKKFPEQVIQWQESLKIVSARLRKKN